MVFKVLVVETLTREVTVIADNKEEAKGMVKDLYDCQAIVLGAEDHALTEFL